MGILVISGSCCLRAGPVSLGLAGVRDHALGDVLFEHVSGRGAELWAAQGPRSCSEAGPRTYNYNFIFIVLEL